jgi:hypothetical protein
MDRQTGKPKNESAPEIVEFSVIRDSRCTECGEDLWKGRLLRLEGEKALCMGGADLDRLEFLPAGDAAVTRRASKYSKLRAVVLCWSRTRKPYERQSILVEPEALQRAESESLADAEVRARRQERAAERRALEDQEYVAAFASAIRVQYPGCSATDGTAIAGHACRKDSGRVGRIAAAKEFSPEVCLAVIAHIRHVHTDCDELLARYADRGTARERIRSRVSEILAHWEQAGASP